MARLLLTYLLPIVLITFSIKGEQLRHGYNSMNAKQYPISFVSTPIHSSPAETATTTGCIIGFFDSSSFKIRTTKDENTKLSINLCTKLQSAKAHNSGNCNCISIVGHFESNSRLIAFKVFRI